MRRAGAIRLFCLLGASWFIESVGLFLISPFAPGRCMLVSVSKRVVQAVSGLILLLATLAPMAELFDHWDKANGPDTELRVTIVFVSAGVALTLTHLVRQSGVVDAAVRPLQSRVALRYHSRTSAVQTSAPTASPPIPLRI